MDDLNRVVIAEILRPRGNRGELLARSQTDVPGRLESLKKAHVRLPNGLDEEVELTEAWPHKGDWVLKFAGVDSIDAAARFQRADLWVAPSDRAGLPEGEFFRSDLTGCSVVDQATGEHVGIVEGWKDYGGPPLMAVSTPTGERLIPFVAALAEVDLVARTIRVALPDGLLDL